MPLWGSHWFPTAVRPGVEVAGPKYFCSHVHLRVEVMTNFNLISPMTAAEDLALALGPAARSLGKVLDLI